MLILDNISVKYGQDCNVLDNVNLELKSGEFSALVGSNGSGKSTLVKAISGEIYVNSGSILLDKADITSKPSLERSRFIARVFQNTHIGTVPFLSIKENMILASKRGINRGFRKASIEGDLLKEKLSELGMGLEKIDDKLVSSLSGGQRQALSVLMATLMPAKLLLLDEHTAALDPKAAKSVMEFTQNIVREHGITTFMITHNMEDIKMCDSIYSIENGKIVRL
ncbi:ABC transporter ATP-binding protein [Candidatus Cyrtobacter comes]|uniref:ABC transporter ATP-binding protein n=1 Tax=Candidatus Cyrtobacter comes TaxID=675776 RepID=A0ABU5LA22_9RICK|nr:ATP-binding cassette domain-containing protein [Candidatus Cyrtobacter comes]MDZ5762745.1 ABC transporter ATP-binding protein [Candidatus Cyrtobacter comes]